MLAVILGLAFIVAGGFGILAWKGDFLIVLRGLMPLMFLVGGLISVVAGSTSIKESYDPKINEENPPSENK